MPNETLILDTLSLSDETNFQLEHFDVPPAKRKQQWASSADADGDALIQQSHYDNVAATFQIRCTAQASIDLAHDLIARVNAQLVEAEIRATAEPTVQCLPAGLPAYWTPAGSTRTGILVVQSGTIDERPLTVEGDDAGYFLTNPMPVIRGTLNCLPGVYASVLETVAPVSASAPTVQISVPNVPGDMLAPTELTITDTVGGGQERKYADWGMDVPAVQAGRTNLCTNPKAMVNTAGWTNSGLSTFTATAAASPVASTVFDTTNAGVGDSAQFSLSVVNGHTYTASGYMRTLSNVLEQVSLKVFDAGSVQKGASSEVTYGAWTRVSVTFTANATATWTVRMMQDTAAAIEWQFTGVLIEESATLQAFFDGDSPNTIWNGTANASTSTTQLPLLIDATQLLT